MIDYVLVIKPNEQQEEKNPGDTSRSAKGRSVGKSDIICEL